MMDRFFAIGTGSYAARIVACAVFVIVSISAGTGKASAQTRPGDWFRWDQPTSEVASIARFEVRVDGGAWVAVTPEAASDAQTLANHTSFRAVVPALTTGTHAFAVRACPASGACSAPSADFSFTVLIISTPTNLRIGPGE